MAGKAILAIFFNKFYNLLFSFSLVVTWIFLFISKIFFCLAFHKISIKLGFEFCGRAPLKLNVFFLYFYFINLIVKTKNITVYFFLILILLSITLTLIFFPKKLCFFTYQSVTKRLQSELRGLMMQTDKGISAFPEMENMFNWNATIDGPQDTVFEGHKYNLRLQFSGKYPIQAPTVTFTTPIFHPNVDEQVSNKYLYNK